VSRQDGRPRQPTQPMWQIGEYEVY
jgi:hypothetical protein